MATKTTHDKLRDILKEYGNPEFGDLIIDDICQLFNFPTTIDAENDDEIKNIKLPIYWSTNDFEAKAESNFNDLKEDNPEEVANLENWEQLYDKTQFTHQLERMISSHDATIGITWLTVEEYLGNCEIR